MPPPPIFLEYVRARAGGDAFAFQSGPQTYLVRTPGGGFRELRFDWDDTLLADLANLANPLASARVGERLRALVENTPLATVEVDLSEGASAWISLRSAASELYALPWELLALRPSGVSLGQLPNLLITQAWPESRTRSPSPNPRPEGGRILFAYSDAGGPVPSDEHQNAIRDATLGVLPFDGTEDVLADTSLHTLTTTLETARQAGRPFSVLHLLAHGVAGPDGGALLLTGSKSAQRIDAAALRGALLPFLDNLRLVVLCACQGAEVGQPGNPLGGIALALHRAGVEAVLGARQPLGIAASIGLTETLYTELLQHSTSLESAFLAARPVAGASLQLWTRAEDGGDTRPFVLRPFRGLLAFEASDQHFFFGRDAERALLLRRVLDAAEGLGPRFQVLCGATGSGKSSLLRAGLLPQLAARGWTVALVRPAQDPIPALDAALDALDAKSRLLVLVDPFQELFTAVSEAAERQAIAAALWEASQDARVVVLAGVRVDYLGRCEEVFLGRGGLRLDSLVYDEAHRLFLAALGPTQLRLAAAEPVARVGLVFEAGLLDVLLTDAGTEPGALPVLQHVLDRLWTQREGRTLTHGAWREMGGLSGALASSAEEVLAALSPEEQEVARRLLVALVAVGQDGRLAARRAARLRELLPAAAEARARAERVLERFVACRLVVVGEQGGEIGAEIAHEALLRRWETLRAWVDADHDLHRRTDELLALAAAWRQHRAEADGGAAYLLRGSRLGYAREILASAGAYPSQDVVDFVAASGQAEAEIEAARLAELALRERLAASALASAQRARDAALLASAHAGRAADPTLALQLLREVVSPDQPLDWALEAMAVLHAPLCVASWARSAARLDPSQDPPSPAPAGDFPILRARRSPDGTRIAQGSSDGRVRVLSAEGELVAMLRGHVGAILDLDWSADGSTLVSASEDGTARLWTLSDLTATVFRGFARSVRSARLSPAGDRLMAAGGDGKLRLWDLPGGQERLTRDLGAPALCAAWGSRLLVGDGRGRVWVLGPDGAVSTTLLGHRGAVDEVAWQPDGTVLSAGRDGLVRAWRIDPAPVAPALLRARVRRTGDLVWSADGERLACGGADGTATVLRPDAPLAPAVVSTGHREAVRAIAWSPDGSRLLSGGNDDAARLWSSADGRTVGMLVGHESAVCAVAWSPDGGTLATGDMDGNTYLWTAEGRRLDALCFKHNNEVQLLAFSADGRFLLSLCADRTARVLPLDGSEGWTLGTAWTRRGAAGEGHSLTAAVWAEDRLVFGSAAGVVLGMSLEDRAVKPLATLGGSVSALASDGARFAAASEDGAVWFGAGGGGSALVAPGTPVLRWLRFQPGGRLLLGLDASDQLWALDLSGTRERVVLSGTARVLRAALSPFGDRVAAACEDGLVRVWPAGTARLRALLWAASSASLDPDQRRRYLGE